MSYSLSSSWDANQRRVWWQKIIIDHNKNRLPDDDWHLNDESPESPSPSPTITNLLHDPWSTGRRSWTNCGRCWTAFSGIQHNWENEVDRRRQTWRTPWKWQSQTANVELLENWKPISAHFYRTSVLINTVHTMTLTRFSMALTTLDVGPMIQIATCRRWLWLTQFPGAKTHKWTIQPASMTLTIALSIYRWRTQIRTGE